MNHLNTNRLLSDRQYGIQVDLLYLDFMKAFDTVPFRRLINKLGSYGIGGKVLAWIKAFLSGCSQRMSVHSSFSSWMEVLIEWHLPGECSWPTTVCIIHKRPPRWIDVRAVYVCRRHQSIQRNKRRHMQTERHCSQT